MLFAEGEKNWLAGSHLTTSSYWSGDEDQPTVVDLHLYELDPQHSALWITVWGRKSIYVDQIKRVRSEQEEYRNGRNEAWFADAAVSAVAACIARVEQDEHLSHNLPDLGFVEESDPLGEFWHISITPPDAFRPSEAVVRRNDEACWVDVKGIGSYSAISEVISDKLAPVLRSAEYTLTRDDADDGWMSGNGSRSQIYDHATDGSRVRTTSERVSNDISWSLKIRVSPE